MIYCIYIYTIKLNYLTVQPLSRMVVLFVPLFVPVLPKLRPGPSVAPEASPAVALRLRALSPPEVSFDGAGGGPELLLQGLSLVPHVEADRVVPQPVDVSSVLVDESPTGGWKADVGRGRSAVRL